MLTETHPSVAPTTQSSRGNPDLLWVYRRGRTQGFAEWSAGKRSSDFFYGYTALRDRYRAGFIEDVGFNPLFYPWYPIEWWMARRVGSGFAAHLSLWNLKALRRAKVVVSTGDVCGLPIALLKKMGLVNAQLIYITHGLSDNVRTFGAGRPLARFYRWLLLSGVDTLVTLSEGARQGLADWLNVPAERIKMVPYGTDVHFWRNTAPANHVGEEILSVGSDAGRDFETLLKSGGGHPVHIVSNRDIDLDQYPNAYRTTQHSFEELRDLYSKSRFVVVSLHDKDQPSGQSTGLQAMACGKPVIITRTRGWWGENILKDGENCLIVPPNDAGALSAAIEWLWTNPEGCAEIGQRARQAVEKHFDESRMVASLSGLIEGL